MIETICHNNEVIAIIIYQQHQIEENIIEFVSPQDYLLQLGYMNRPKGYKVIPHIHHPVRRETFGTQEVLFIKEGKDNRLEAVTTDEHPVLKVQTGRGQSINKAKFKADKMVEVMGWKAVGAKLTDFSKTVEMEWEKPVEDKSGQGELFG